MIDTTYTRIKALRTELNLSQTELAKRVGYSDKTAIAKVEAGKVDLPQSKVIAFAKALCTTPSYLIGENSNNDSAKSSYSDSENTIIEKYRTISEFSPKGKESVDYILDREYELAKELEEKSNDNIVVMEPSSPYEVNAAHALPGATPEEKQHDDDIMERDDF